MPTKTTKPYESWTIIFNGLTGGAAGLTLLLEQFNEVVDNAVPDTAYMYTLFAAVIVNLGLRIWRTKTAIKA